MDIIPLRTLHIANRKHILLSIPGQCVLSESISNWIPSLSILCTLLIGSISSSLYSWTLRAQREHFYLDIIALHIVHLANSIFSFHAWTVDSVCSVRAFLPGYHRVPILCIVLVRSIPSLSILCSLLITVCDLSLTNSALLKGNLFSLLY